MQLDGPGSRPSPAASRHLVVLLHGVAANGRDLLFLREAWRELLPERSSSPLMRRFRAIMRLPAANGSACRTDTKKAAGGTAGRGRHSR